MRNESQVVTTGTDIYDMGGGIGSTIPSSHEALVTNSNNSTSSLKAGRHKLSDTRLDQNVKEEIIDMNEENHNILSSTEPQRTRQHTSHISYNNGSSCSSSKTAQEILNHLEEKTGLTHDSSVLMI